MYFGAIWFGKHARTHTHTIESGNLIGILLTNIVTKNQKTMKLLQNFCNKLSTRMSKLMGHRMTQANDR